VTSKNTKYYKTTDMYNVFDMIKAIFFGMNKTQSVHDELDLLTIDMEEGNMKLYKLYSVMMGVDNLAAVV